MQRLQSWKNPCYTIMKDYTRVDFIERARALHPTLFRSEDTSLPHEEALLNEPDVLNEDIVVRLHGEGVTAFLERNDEAEFGRFLREHKYQVPADTGSIRSHKQLRLNGVQIRTAAADINVQTYDSVICARLGDDGDQRCAPSIQR